MSGYLSYLVKISSSRAMSPSHLNVTVTPSTGTVRVDGKSMIQRSVAVEGTFDNPNTASEDVPEAIHYAYQYALASMDRLSKLRVLDLEEDRSLFSTFLGRLGKALPVNAAVTGCETAIMTRPCGTSPLQQSDAKVYSEEVDNNSRKTKFSFTLVSDGTDLTLGGVRANLFKLAPANDDDDTLEYRESLGDYERRVVQNVPKPEGLGLVTSNAVEEGIVHGLSESPFQAHLLASLLASLNVA